jgi:short subunit dehydrogenase-like uncharacterized protein
MADANIEKQQIVIYGSYGYTGKIISETASKSSNNIVLSGRNGSKLKEQASELGLPFKAVNLDHPAELDNLLKNAAVVIHCAGPFHRTWKPMLDGCIRNGCHYLDITGEIDVFEGIKSRNKEIEKAGIMAMPGVGFDVVPTDCMALYLKKKLPDAVHLELAFMGLGGGISHGTAQTMADNLGSGSVIREDGKIKKVPAAYKVKEIDFGEGTKTAASIPWGDVSTAHFTTGIPNITVYTAMKRSAVRMMKFSTIIGPILSLNAVKSLIKKWISKNVNGPDNESREKGTSVIWGRVENEKGETKEARLITQEGYKLTAETAWLIAQKVIAGNYYEGYQTPAAVYGEKLILEAGQSEFIAI